MPPGTVSCSRRAGRVSPGAPPATGWGTEAMPRWSGEPPVVISSPRRIAEASESTPTRSVAKPSGRTKASASVLSSRMRSTAITCSAESLR